MTPRHPIRLGGGESDDGTLPVPVPNAGVVPGLLPWSLGNNRFEWMPQPLQMRW